MEKMTKEQIKHRLILMNRVKQLRFLPQGEVLTLKQVADYFEVSPKTIKETCKSCQDEFNDEDVCIKYPADFKIFNNNPYFDKTIREEKDNLVLMINETTEIVIPNKGILCFSQRAVVLLGMLLDRSRVATELRNQLLNLIMDQYPNKTESDLIEDEREFFYKVAHEVIEKIISPEEAMVKIYDYKCKHLTYWL